MRKGVKFLSCLAAFCLCFTLCLPTGAKGTIVYQYASKGGKARICLTFDDGPGPYTEMLLDVLAKYNVKATFFVVGKKIDQKTGEYISRAYNEGHEIGNHTYLHANLQTTPEERIKKQILDAEKTILELTDQRPKLLLAQPCHRSADPCHQKFKRSCRSVFGENPQRHLHSGTENASVRTGRCFGCPPYPPLEPGRFSPLCHNAYCHRCRTQPN